MRPACQYLDHADLNNLIILHVHKEQVDRLDLDKIGENYFSGCEDKLRKIG